MSHTLFLLSTSAVVGIGLTIGVMGTVAALKIVEGPVVRLLSRIFGKAR